MENQTASISGMLKPTNRKDKLALAAIISITLILLTVLVFILLSSINKQGASLNTTNNNNSLTAQANSSQNTQLDRVSSSLSSNSNSAETTITSTQTSSAAKTSTVSAEFTTVKLKKALPNNDGAFKEWVIKIPNNLGWTIVPQTADTLAGVNLSSANAGLAINLEIPGGNAEITQTKSPVTTVYNNGAGDISSYLSYEDENGKIYHFGYVTSPAMNGERKFTPFVEIDYGIDGAKFSVYCNPKSAADLNSCNQILAKIVF